MGSWVAYPAMLIVSGETDEECHLWHAHKMVTHLQAANTSPYPIFLGCMEFRGQSPPRVLSRRIEALTNRLAFICN